MATAAWQRIFILISMLLLTVMLNIDVTALNIAVPVIATDFNASLSNMQWVINAYVLGSACFQILGGKLGDCFGHKKIFLWGTFFFVLTSMIAGISPNEKFLITCRGLQGLALGIAYPLTYIITCEVFPKHKQAFALSLIISTAGASLAIGPLIGGLLVEYLNWRWIFFINVPLGIITLWLCKKYCHSSEKDPNKQIDYKIASLLVFGLFALTLATNEVQYWGVFSKPFLIVLLLGILLFVSLYLLERKSKDPIFPFQLFKIKNFSLHTVIRFFVQIVFIPVLFFFPIYLQNIAGYSPLISGVLTLSLTLGIGILSPLGGKWIDKIGDKTPTFIACLFFTLGSFLFLFLQKEPNLYLMEIGLLCIGIGTAISFVSTTTGTLTQVKESMHGIGMGVFLTVAWVSCAFGIAISGAILAMSSKAHLIHLISKKGISLTSEQFLVAKKVARGIAPFSRLQESFPASLQNIVSEICSQSFIKGFHLMVISWIGISILGAFFSLLLERKKTRISSLHNSPL